MSRRVIAIVTDNLHGSEPVEQILANADSDGVELRVVVPAIEANALRHTLGDIDEPKQEAEERLRAGAARRCATTASRSAARSATPTRCRPPRTRC